MPRRITKPVREATGSASTTTASRRFQWDAWTEHGNADGVDHGNGVICRGGGPATDGGVAPIVTTNMDIRDGASKTFLLGEAVPAWCGWSLWFWFDGSTATCGIPLNFRVSGKTAALQQLADRLARHLRLHEPAQQRRELRHVRRQRTLYQRLSRRYYDIRCCSGNGHYRGIGHHRRQ